MIIIRMHPKLILVSTFVGLLVCCALNLAVAYKLDLFCKIGGHALAAIPAAISVSVFNHPPDYTELKHVSIAFDAALKGSDCASVDAAIATATRSVSESNAYQTLGNDDKGLNDLVRWSFDAFGWHAKSIPIMYLIILFTSASVFVFSYPRFAILAFSFLIAHALFLPYVAKNQQLSTFLNLRFVPVLGIMASFHLAIAAYVSDTRGWKYLTVLFQSLVLAMTLHLRIPGLWLVVPVLGAAALVLLGFGPLTRKRPEILACIFPVVVMLVVFLGGNAIQRTISNEDYKNDVQLDKHVVWHSLISGWAFEPLLGEQWAIKIDDVSVIAAVGKWLKQRGETERWNDIGGLTPGFSGIQWAPYERAARDMYLDVCRHEFVHCVFGGLVWKPIVLISNVLWATQLRSDMPMPEKMDAAARSQMEQIAPEMRGLMWLTPFSILAAVLIIAVNLPVLSENHVPWRVGFIAIGLMDFASALPSLVGYSVPYRVSEPALMFVVTAYFLALWIIYRLFVFSSSLRLRRVRK